jgi:hypothetical protein
MPSLLNARHEQFALAVASGALAAEAIAATAKPHHVCDNVTTYHDG